MLDAVTQHEARPHSQPFSRKSRTPTIAREFQIGFHDFAEADLEHFWDCCSAGFLGKCLSEGVDHWITLHFPASTSRLA